MIALSFAKPKEIWEILFQQDTFDSFLLKEASFAGNYAVTLEQVASSGNMLNVPYSRVRPLLAAFMQQTAEADNISPKGYIVLKASDTYLKSLMANPAFSADPDTIKGLILTFRLENGSFTVLTGISYQSFTLDKSIDALWDQAILKAFAHMNIAFTQL